MTPYRPFFLMVGLAAIAGGLVWWVPLAAGQRVFAHLHILLFGMGGAAVAGYLLTALPSWAAHASTPAWLLRVLITLWLMGRGTPFIPESVRPLALAAGALFGLLLSAHLIRHIIAAGAWARLPLGVAPLLLAPAELLIVQDGFPSEGPDLAGAWASTVFALLIVLVGGRAVPAFTESALRVYAWPGRVWTCEALQSVSAGVIVAALFALLVHQSSHLGGSLLLVAGVLQLTRLAGWQPLRVWRLAPVGILQVSWLWLGLGLMLLGVALTWPEVVRQEVALHALTMGAMGGMILAIASRVAMRRGRFGLWPTRLQLVAAALILLSPVPRLIAARLWPANGIALAALCWIAGWLLFVLALWPALRGPPPHPVLSGPRPDSINGTPPMARGRDMRRGRFPGGAEPRVHSPSVPARPRPR